MSKLTDREINQITEFYIGISGGYLGDFYNRRTLREFYQVDCDLDINPSKYQVTIKEEFVDILKNQSARGQAVILREVIDRFYVESDWNETTKQDKLRPGLEQIVVRLEELAETSIVETESPHSTSETVRLAIEEADDLVRRGLIPSAVDRSHTALHAHLKFICEEQNIELGETEKITTAFKRMRTEHPAFLTEGPRQQDVEKMMQGLATTIDGLNTIRNKASLAHKPATTLLKEAEATLAINAARSIFNYVEDKMQDYYAEKNQAKKQLAIDDIPF